MAYQPIGDRLIIERVEKESVTPGGIVLPDGAKERPTRGVVIASGPGAWDSGVFVPNICKEGDTVIYGKYSGAELTPDGNIVAIRHDDVIAIVK